MHHPRFLALALQAAEPDNSMLIIIIAVSGDSVLYRRDCRHRLDDLFYFAQTEESPGAVGVFSGSATSPVRLCCDAATRTSASRQSMSLRSAQPTPNLFPPSRSQTTCLFLHLPT